MHVRENVKVLGGVSSHKCMYVLSTILAKTKKDVYCKGDKMNLQKGSIKFSSAEVK